MVGWFLSILVDEPCSERWRCHVNRREFRNRRYTTRDKLLARIHYKHRHAGVLPRSEDQMECTIIPTDDEYFFFLLRSGVGKKGKPTQRKQTVPSNVNITFTDSHCDRHWCGPLLHPVMERNASRPVPSLFPSATSKCNRNQRLHQHHHHHQQTHRWWNRHPPLLRLR